MTLKEKDRDILVRLKVEKSLATLSDAKRILDGGMWAAGANRLYYAAYYAVSALLLQNGHTVKTHEGVMRIFGQFFVKSGFVDKELGTVYPKLFSLRLTGDYDDDYDLTENEVVPNVENAERLILAVIKLIDNHSINTNNN